MLIIPIKDKMREDRMKNDFIMYCLSLHMNQYVGAKLYIMIEGVKSSSWGDRAKIIWKIVVWKDLQLHGINEDIIQKELDMKKNKSIHVTIQILISCLATEMSFLFN